MPTPEVLDLLLSGYRDTIAGAWEDLKATGPDQMVYATAASVAAVVSADADDTASALKGGFHALVGVRIPVAGKWALTIENRVAFSQKAKGGFKDINLGGNFSTLGCSYRF